jgi:hypothetical protein
VQAGATGPAAPTHTPPLGKLEESAPVALAAPDAPKARGDAAPGCARPADQSERAVAWQQGSPRSTIAKLWPRAQRQAGAAGARGSSDGGGGRGDTAGGSDAGRGAGASRRDQGAGAAIAVADYRAEHAAYWRRAAARRQAPT